jgi:hypothetical protein
MEVECFCDIKTRKITSIFGLFITIATISNNSPGSITYSTTLESKPWYTTTTLISTRKFPLKIFAHISTSNEKIFKTSCGIAQRIAEANSNDFFITLTSSSSSIF